MADILLLPWLKHARTRVRYMDNTGVSRSPYNGVTKTGSFGGDRLAASIEFTAQGGKTTQRERTALIAFLAKLRGRQNRAYLTDNANRLRGSFPATELLSNNTFASGTTGWSAVNSSSHTVSDRVSRVGLGNGAVGAGYGIGPSASIAVTQYAPYAVRAFVESGRGTVSGNLSALIGSSLGAGDYSSGGSLTAGMLTSAGVIYGTTAVPFIGGLKVSGNFSADYFVLPYTSFSRCALGDNAPNALLQSDDFTTTWTNTRSTDSANADVAPNGSTTADRIIEDGTASNTHLISQSVTVTSAVLDYAFGVALKAGTRTWVRLTISEATGGSNTSCYFNLSTGVLGTIGTGANWADTRAFIVGMGNGWYHCCVVGRKTNAATSLSANISLATADNVSSYSGDGTSYISAWRGTLAQSSVPTRLAQTTTVASTGTSQTGSALHIKGLPASESALLMPADQFEVITSRGSELKIVTAALNSDAAGLGYLQFEPPLRGVPADNAPIIIHEPMGRFIFGGEIPEWVNEPGVFTTASADFEEA